jgi:hypothetical protein
MTTSMTTGTTPGQPGTIAQSAIDAINTVVRERQNLVDEWRQRGDNSLPPRECVFTAYNITKEVQQKHREWAPHSQVRDLVHDAISRIMVMDECLIDIPGVTTRPGIERPRLYHPPEISHQVAEQIFSNYGHIGVNVKMVPANVLGDGGATSQLALPGPSGSIAVLTPAAQATITATPGTGGKQQDGTYAVDKRGRLWIPADMLRSIQAQSGTNVYVTISNGGDGNKFLMITPSPPAGATHAAMYRVDASNNIAVSKSAFDEAGLTSGKFYIVGSSADIRITAA